ncbi:hypothetical protein AB0953_21245 [Streptomyces sp. NPDC046866]|uniref:hypothetical protein n=1 Tax=Streptomyces sp. NPDC046866 TaxID=3154921 RepID=UPI003455B739
MTEAVTTPNPFEPPPQQPASAGAPDGAGGRITAGDVRDGAAITLVVGVAGVLLGLLWVWLAPRAQYVSNGEAVFLRNTESEARIGADAVFLLLSVGLGLLSGALVFLWRRRGGVPQVVGLGAGSCLAALLGWRTGLWLGPTQDVAAAALKAGKGVPFDAPLQLLAHGVLLGWPMAALALHLALTALWAPHDPAPAAPDGPYPPPHVHGGGPVPPAAPEPPQP